MNQGCLQSKIVFCESGRADFLAERQNILIRGSLSILPLSARSEYLLDFFVIGKGLLVGDLSVSEFQFAGRTVWGLTPALARGLAVPLAGMRRSRY